MPTELEYALQEAEVPVEFEDAREEALIKEAVLAHDVQDWLLSPLGRWVIGAAVQDQKAIEAQLVKVKPWRKRRISELQQKHEAVGMAVTWLTEAINIGLASQRELEAEQVTR